MFGSAALDVAIGVVFIVLMVSLLVTAASEIIASYLRWRAANLWNGLESLLRSGRARDELYTHPLITGLAPHMGKTGARFSMPAGPSYIPSRTFALALVDIIRRPAAAAGAVAPVLSVPDAIARLSASAETTDLQRVLAAYLDEAEGDIDRFRENIETWFNNGMDRVSGWYKRRMQVLNLLIALAIACVLNIDLWRISESLWTDNALRAAVVAQAGQFAAAQPADPAVPVAPEARFRNLSTAIKATGLPIGWQCQGPGRTDVNVPWCGTNTRWWLGTSGLAVLFGWLLTAIAASLGAPFWFDVLNKIISIRAAGRAPEEKQKSPRVVPKPREAGDVKV